MAFMTSWLFVFCLAALPRWIFSDIQVIETGPAVVRPGSQLNLVCKVTGFSITTAYYAWDWVREPPGKSLEWLAAITPTNGGHWIANSVKGRVTVSSDNSRNELSLQLNSATAADSSVYFCVRQYTNYFEYWGKGTSVVVTSESPKAPSLFPLIPSGDNPGTTDIAIGCIAKNFLPNSIDFSWNNPSNQSIGNENFMKFPSILSGGTYTAASQAKVSLESWNTFKPYYCKADHPQGVRVTSVVRQYGGPLPREPSMLIRAPVLASFSSSYLNSTVTCEVSDLCSGNVVISWLKEQRDITTGITTSKPIPNGHGGYTVWSKLVITKEDWVSEKTFTCKVKSKAFNHEEAFSLTSFCSNDGCELVTVETIPPTFADMFLTKSANLTCRISNIPVTAEYSKLNVTWTRASDQKQLPTVMTNFLEQENNFYYVDAIATVCATEWDEKEAFTCKVTLEDILIKPVEKALEKKMVGEPKAPVAYILLPSLEQMTLREKVTLTCFIKGFNPGDYFVRWLQNEQAVSESEYFTSKAIAESKTQSKEYFAYSMLDVNEQDWSAGDSFTCIVGHEALPYGSIQKTVNKNTGKPSIVNVSLVLSDASTPCY